MNESIDIRHLRYFLVVAQTENFTRAAERLNVSQPSVSQQMMQLERTLRTPLFKRIGKRVYLTEAGATFRHGAETVLRKLDEACNAVTDIAALTSAHVQIGVIPALHASWVPPLLEVVAREHPGLSIGVKQMASSDVESELEAGRLDIGFGLMTHNSPSLRYEKLVSEPFSLIVTEDSAFAQRESIPASELADMRVALLQDSFDMRRAADDLVRLAKARLKVVFEVDNIEPLLATVARTGIPTLLPAIVLSYRDRSGLKAIPITGKAKKMEFGLIWSSTESIPPATMMLANMLKTMILSK